MLLSCSLMASRTGNQTTDGILLETQAVRCSKAKPYVLISGHTNEFSCISRKVLRNWQETLSTRNHNSAKNSVKCVTHGNLDPAPRTKNEGTRLPEHLKADILGTRLPEQLKADKGELPIFFLS